MNVPFRTSLITDEASQDVAVAVELAKAYGLDGLEIRNAWGKGPHQWSDDEVRHIADIAGEAGMPVCCVSPPFFKCEVDDLAEVERHLDILRQSCDVAHRLGAGLVRGFAFWRHGPLEDVKEKVVPPLVAAAAIVKEEGLILALENEFATHNNNVQRTLELIEAVESPHVSLIFDPGNDVHEPEGELPWPDAYDLARSTMVHMHLKDPYKDHATGKVHTGPIGDGDTHVAETMAALKRDGYSGYISLETHYTKEPTPEELESLPARVRESAGAYLSSRECMERWMEMLRAL